MHREPPTFWESGRRLGAATKECFNIKRKWEAPWAATCSRERYHPAVAA